MIIGQIICNKILSFSVVDLSFEFLMPKFKKDGRSTKEIWSFTLLPPSYYGLVIFICYKIENVPLLKSGSNGNQCYNSFLSIFCFNDGS